jgi:exopolysaccharide production protein ExoZ
MPDLQPLPPSAIATPPDPAFTMEGAGERSTRWARTKAGLRGYLASIYELSDEGSRFRSMEGIRGLAILLVFFVHYHTLFSPYAGSGSLTFRISALSHTIGNSGVDLFFVLSGFLIYGAVIRRPVNYFKFLKRRVVRIYPTFLSVFGLYLGLSLIFPFFSKLPPGNWEKSKYLLANLALLPGIFSITPLITVAWSLSYEFFFYLTIPLLVWALAMRRWQRWHRVAFFLALVILRFTIVHFLPIRMVMFIGGILVYEALQSDSLRSGLSLSGEAFAAGVFLGSFVPIALLGRVGESASPVSHSANYLVLVMWTSFSLFALYCLGRNGFLSGIFSWTPLRWMGNMSYSYYLIHGVTLQGFRLLALHVWAATGRSPVLYWTLLPLAILFTIISSTVLFCLVEKRFSLQNK